MHYQRWYKHGDPLVVLPSRTHDVKHGTANEYGNFGCRCLKCREAWRVEIALSQKARSVMLGHCLMEGCEFGQYAKGYCKAHYERQRTGRSINGVLRRRPGAWVI
jgi:hypothetical protein